MTLSPIRFGRMAVAMVIAFVLVAALLFGLEQVGVSPVKATPSEVLNLQPASHATGTDFGNPGGNPAKHCNKTNGKDNPQNKHCRAPSPG